MQLAVDRGYEPGEPILAWCGPQPNSKLLINYGIVDANNPHDKLPLSSEWGRAGQGWPGCGWWL